MSKKAHKNQPAPEIVDQQKDPMLRALQKKVRNINKKLTEIAQLSTKKDLKPEQEEKISKKPQVEQQKAKYLEMVEVYREIAAESEKIIRKTQLAELEDLATLIAAKEFAVDLGFQFNQNVDNTFRLLITPTSATLNLKERIDQIYEALTFTANHSKLKKSLKDYVQANATKTKQSITANEEVESAKKQEMKVPEVEKEKKVQVPVEMKVEEPVVTEPVVTIEAPKTEEMVAVAQPEAIPQAEATEVNKTEEGPREEGKGERRGGYRGYKGRGPREDRNGDRPNNDPRPQRKRNFKPKFEGEQQQNKRDLSSSSSSYEDSEPKARQFKREEVRELIEEGFIVVGKPKPKARDQKQYHDKEHGKKNFHNPHTKKNY